MIPLLIIPLNADGKIATVVSQIIASYQLTYPKVCVCALFSLTWVQTADLV